MAFSREIKELLVKIRADNSELDKAMLKTATHVEAVGRRMDRVGKSLTLEVSAPLLALGAVSLRSSIQFENAMAGVSKTVDASAERIAALGDEFTDLSEEIPVARQELARIGEAAGQLGIETDAILGFTQVMADLGVATNLSSDEAATALARLANVTGLPQDEFDRLGATVVALGNNLATTEREIVEMGQRLAGAGTQVGLTEAQILSLAGSLSSVGIEAEAGGTAFSRVLADMAIAAGKGGEKLEDLAEVAGLSAGDFAKAFEEDAAEALVLFVEGLARLKAQGVNVFGVLENLGLGNVRVRDSLLRASAAGDKMREALELGSEAWEENSALTEEAGKFYETTGNHLQVALNKLSNVTGELGDELQPVLIQLIEVAKPVLEVVRGMIKAFGELPDLVKVATFGLVGLTIAIGPLTIGLGQLTIAIGALKGVAALGGLATLVGPGAVVLVGLTALAAIFLALKGRVDEAGESLAKFQRETRAALASASTAEAQAAKDAARLEVQQALADKAKAADELAKPNTLLPQQGGGFGTNSLEESASTLATIRKTSATDEAQRRLERANEAFRQAEARLNQLKAEAAAAANPPPGTEDDGPADGIQKIVDRLAKDITAINTLATVDGSGFDELAARTNAYKRALQALAAEGMEPTNELFQETAQKLEDATKAQRVSTEATKEEAAQKQALNQILEASIPKFQRIKEQQVLLNEAFAEEKISVEEFARAMDFLKDQLEESPPQFAALSRAGLRFANVFTDTISSAALNGMASFKRFADFAIRELARIAAKFLVFQAITSFFPGSGFALSIGKAFGFGGERAQGGPVDPSRAFLIGEEGPELFVPGVAGQVISNRDLLAGAAGGGSVTLNATFVTADGRVVAQVTRVMQKDMDDRDEPFEIPFGMVAL